MPAVAATAIFRSSSRMSSVFNYPLISIVLTLVGHGADSAQAEPRSGVEGRLAGGRRRRAGGRDRRLPAARRGEHRQAACGARARGACAHAQIQWRRIRRDRSRALQESLPARPFRQRLLAGRRKHRAAAAGFERDDRRHGRRHRCGQAACASALLHLARRQQRLQGDRGGEKGGRARRRLPRDGRRRRVAGAGPVAALAGDARSRDKGGERPCDRQSAAQGLHQPHRPQEPSQDRRHRRERSPIAAARTAPIRSFG